jgi:hypothetical protein
VAWNKKSYTGQALAEYATAAINQLHSAVS